MKKPAFKQFAISYGLSNGGGFMLIQATVASYFTLFLTDTFGIPAGITSILMFAVTLFDAVKDPFIGAAVDRYPIWALQALLFNFSIPFYDFQHAAVSESKRTECHSKADLHGSLLYPVRLCAELLHDIRTSRPSCTDNRQSGAEFCGHVQHDLRCGILYHRFILYHQFREDSGRLCPVDVPLWDSGDAFLLDAVPLLYGAIFTARHQTADQ